MEYTVYDYESNFSDHTALIASHLSGLSVITLKNEKTYYQLDDQFTLITGLAGFKLDEEVGNYEDEPFYQFQRDRDFIVVNIDGKGQVVKVAERLYIPLGASQNIALLHKESIHNLGGGYREFGKLEATFPLHPLPSDGENTTK